MSYDWVYNWNERSEVSICTSSGWASKHCEISTC